MVFHGRISFLIYTSMCSYLLTLNTVLAIGSGKGSARHRLLQDLISNYPTSGKYVPPRQSPYEAVSVGMSVIVRKVLHVNQEKETVAIRVFYEYTWRDDFLSWNPRNYSGVDSTVISTKQLWVPDVKVFNIESEECINNEDASLYSTGTVMWVPSCVQEIGCNIDPLHFPFDNHQCVVTLGSWLHSNRSLTLRDVRVALPHTNPQIQQEWSLHSINSHMEYVNYNNETFETVVISYWIHHQAPIFAFLLIFPAVLLSVLTTVVFLLPTDSENKINVGMSIFLSFMVLLHILMDSTPKSSTTVPYLGYYFTLNSLLLAMSVFSACIISNINVKATTGHVMQPQFKRVLTLMAKLLLVDHNTLTTVAPREATTRHVEATSAKSVDDGNNQGRKNWILLASVADRFLLFVYVFANVIASVVIFAKYADPTNSQDAANSDS